MGVLKRSRYKMNLLKSLLKSLLEIFDSFQKLVVATGRIVLRIGLIICMVYGAYMVYTLIIDPLLSKPRYDQSWVALLNEKKEKDLLSLAESISHQWTEVWLKRGAKIFQPHGRFSSTEKPSVFRLYGEFLPAQKDGRVFYWNFERPALIDLSRRAVTKDYPLVFVPCVQRVSDSKDFDFIEGWVLLEDVIIEDLIPTSSPAPWVLGELSCKTPERRVLAQYRTLLKRGQRSEKLIYSAPMHIPEGYQRRWRIFCHGPNAILTITLNGRRFLAGPGETLDLTSLKCNGAFVLEVQIGKDSPDPETLVIFEYYIEKGNAA